jgi:hypothetical protein
MPQQSLIVQLISIPGFLIGPPNLKDIDNFQRVLIMGLGVSIFNIIRNNPINLAPPIQSFNQRVQFNILSINFIHILIFLLLVFDSIVDLYLGQ